MFKSVILYTNELKRLRRFYTNIMELPMLENLDNEFTLAVGESNLTFRETDTDAFYHYAINIPGNQFTLIKSMMQQKHKLNREGGRNEVYFESFDADSIYFNDPTGNIVELIGRRHRDLFGAPSPESFLNISEVGMVTYDMTKVGEKIQDIGVPLRQGTEIKPHSLNFLGHGDTFIVLVPPGRKWYFSNKTSIIHPLQITLTNGHILTLDEAGHLTVSKNKSTN